MALAANREKKMGMPRTRDLDYFDPRVLPWAHGRGAVVAVLWDLWEKAESRAEFGDAAAYRAMAHRVAGADQELFDQMAEVAIRGL